MTMKQSQDITIYPILDFISFFSSEILFLASFSLLFQTQQGFLVIVYILGYIFAWFSSRFVRNYIIQQLRPRNNIPFSFDKQTIYTDKYGMPSGHAVKCFYSTTFMYLIFANHWIPLVLLIISLLTLEQRYRYHNHTLSQLFVGTLYGSGVAFACFWIYKTQVVSNNRMTQIQNTTPNMTM
jgi:membrane-associated phospholipid phosphatase